VDPAFPYHAFYGPVYPASKTALNAITLAMIIELESTGSKSTWSPRASPRRTSTDMRAWSLSSRAPERWCALRCLAPTVLQARSRARKMQRSRGDPAKPKHIGQHTGNCAGTSVPPPSRPRRRGVIGVWGRKLWKPAALRQRRTRCAADVRADVLGVALMGAALGSRAFERAHDLVDNKSSKAIQACVAPRVIADRCAVNRSVRRRLRDDGGRSRRNCPPF
jgi:hypothetical protein